MKVAGKFEKVSQDIFIGNSQCTIDAIQQSFDIVHSYYNIKLPKRSTIGSAGYDFFSPFNLEIKPGEAVTIATGIRCKMNRGWVLSIYPRSGLGFKYKVQLMNTVGIIDEDYYNSDNEGHIMIKLYNDDPNHNTITINEGTAFAQGIFTEYGVVEDDDATGIRNGGFGSTGM